MRRTLLAAAVAASLWTTAPSHLFDPLWAFFSQLWGAGAAAGRQGLPHGR